MAVHNSKAVEIVSRAGYFLGKDGLKIRREQFPLMLAWSKTIHKAQGATETLGVVTALTSRMSATPGLAYVAASRSLC